MQKFIIIDKKIKNKYCEYLSSLGYDIFKVPTNTSLYSEISSHTDISLCKVGNKLFVEPTLYKNISKSFNGIDFICGKSILYKKYPLDIKYNLCFLGNKAIHNFKYTDKEILDYIDKNNIEKINVSQGYTNCAIALIDENSCITADIDIAKKLIKRGVDVLLISKENEESIKLLKNNGDFSSMHGLIGGCIGRIEDKIILFGDSEKLVDKSKIIEFIKSKKYKFVDFKGEEIIDYGGMIALEGEENRWKIY